MSGRSKGPRTKRGLVKEAARAQRFAFFYRPTRFRPVRCRTIPGLIAVLIVLELSCGQSVESGGVLIQKSAGLEMQLTAKQLAYRTFHAREIRIIGL